MPGEDVVNFGPAGGDGAAAVAGGDRGALFGGEAADFVAEVEHIAVVATPGLRREGADPEQIAER